MTRIAGWHVVGLEGSLRKAKLHPTLTSQCPVAVEAMKASCCSSSERLGTGFVLVLPSCHGPGIYSTKAAVIRMASRLQELGTRDVSILLQQLRQLRQLQP